VLLALITLLLQVNIPCSEGHETMCVPGQGMGEVELEVALQVGRFCGQGVGFWSFLEFRAFVLSCD
jgi:hypothetical protein